MNFCSYTRKSIYSDHSDSIDNQTRMCREYIDMKFPGQVDTFIEYSDEDFTGANTNRPDLKRMLSDIKDGLYDVLVVYQLDRLSRDVRDFANIYAMLEEHGVKFISIKENIDTSTPIGRAMMYVTVVFAQMERETIAARVTDNMIGLAKKGYWVGGNPPVGYVRKRITINGKQHCTIEQDPSGVEHVKWIFSTFLENNYSLQQMETAFKRQGIKTVRGGFFSTTRLHQILSSPFYVEATPEIYDYYEKKGCQMDPGSPREKWDGTVGVMIYGRTTEKGGVHRLQKPDKWLVCLGMHEPFINAEQWLEVQDRFAKNKFDKTMKYDVPLLKGVLRCSCKTLMGVSRKKKKYGVGSWYYCVKRTRQGPEACNSHHIKCEVLDEKMLDILRSIQKDPKTIQNYVDKNVDNQETPDPKKAASKVASCEAKIGRLASSLALAADSTAQKYIVAEMERLDLELQALKREHSIALASERRTAAEKKGTDAKVKEIIRMMDNLDSFSAKEKNEIMRDIVKECIWDGESLFITL